MDPNPSLTPSPPSNPAISSSSALLSTLCNSIQALGRGFDVTSDIRLLYCKMAPGSRLVLLDETQNRDLVISRDCGLVVPNVLVDIQCSRGRSYRDTTPVYAFHEVVKLKAFTKFENTAEALSAVTLLIDSKPSKGLRKFLRAHCDGETLVVADSKLGNVIKEKLVDTMIIQAIGLLDDLDKELNTYAMRVREWYGWHFPELAKIVQDNIQYAKAVKLMGDRANAAELDFSEILPEEVETELKEAAVVSMGTEVSDLDLINIKELCDQVLALSEYRAQLYDYLKSRMNTVAPNLTALVGELVGARLIAHGGSLLNLAKQPGSTVQILGAEKALFRALKTKHATPKYGLIYHASLIGQAAPKLKGKVARSLAAKTALAIRCDALGDNLDNSMGLENRVKLEARLRNLEGKELGRSAGSTKGKPKIEVYDKDRKQGFGALITSAKVYNPASDVVLQKETEEPQNVQEEEIDTKKKKKKNKPEEEEAIEMEDGEGGSPEGVKKKEKKKKKKSTIVEGDLETNEDQSMGTGLEETKQKKKKKKKADDEVVLAQNEENVEQEQNERKKKKKRKHVEEEEEADTQSKRKEKMKKKNHE